MMKSVWLSPGLLVLFSECSLHKVLGGRTASPLPRPGLPQLVPSEVRTASSIQLVAVCLPLHCTGWIGEAQKWNLSLNILRKLLLGLILQKQTSSTLLNSLQGKRTMSITVSRDQLALYYVSFTVSPLETCGCWWGHQKHVPEELSAHHLHCREGQYCQVFPHSASISSQL